MDSGVLREEFGEGVVETWSKEHKGESLEVPFVGLVMHFSAATAN
jgi:hypothetical protein